MALVSLFMFRNRPLCRMAQRAKITTQAARFSQLRKVELAHFRTDVPSWLFSITSWSVNCLALLHVGVRLVGGLLLGR